MYCWHCGKQLPDVARFCSQCGSAMADDAPAAPAAVAPAPATPAPNHAAEPTLPSAFSRNSFAARQAAKAEAKRKSSWRRR
ncbi:zinc ribbon domain-containing protein [Slackia heliotrinireducens]|uniref:zinc ribbon domain-containing protein n=1 Tax=Slackia heliotrinireducens TaxID=84110 RepID=UPI0033157DD8